MAEKILFFFSALGVFNALLVTIYLFTVRNNSRLANNFLGALLFCLVIRVGISSIHFFGPVPNDIIKLGLVANLMLGPLSLLLTRILIDGDKNLINHSRWHLGLWSVLLILLWFTFDFYVWNLKIRFFIHFVLTCYLVSTLLIWRNYFMGFFSSKQLSENVLKAIVIYLSLVLICIGFAVSLFSSYILGPLVFSVIFYFTIGHFLLKKKKSQSHTKEIDQEEFDKLSQRLTRLMEEEKLYQNSELSLEWLAKRLSIGKHLLSQMLNNNLKKNFHQYVNDYRIDEACRMLKENKHFSVEAIGYEVGFNSRSSFFSAFKKLKGTTPSKYREEK